MSKDIEFKPLTEGLGFHQRFEKKVQHLKEQMNMSDLSKDAIEKAVPPTMPKPALGHLEFEDKEYRNLHKTAARKPLLEDDLALQLSKTLPRDEEKKRAVLPSMPASLASQLPPTSSVGTGATSIEEKILVPEIPFVTVTRRQVLWWSISAAFLDGIILAALFLLLLIALLTVTKIKILTGATGVGDKTVLVAVGLLVLSVVEMYMIIARSSGGCTLSEWAFELRVGRAEQLKKASYPLKVALRTLLVTATGFVVLPLLSFVVGKDLAGVLSGVEMRHVRHPFKRA